ncbi:hypothetical protein [Arthrobacter sp. UYCo732]|uniref:hypothetical protein n=1 Tax=Arthrobacter sp. UYCo732 TaxID=3156336 RepID=UPI003393F065
MTTESPDDLQRAASQALSEQEDYLRSQRHLTDEQLLSQLVETLRKEKAVIDRWVDSGDCFILSGSGKVHLPSCPSMQALVDREAAWAPYLDDLDRVRNWQSSDNAPPMPALMTRADVEDLKRYSSCTVCAPTLDHTDKRPVARGCTLLPAGSLNYRHFGTSLTLVDDGVELGVLTKI